MIINVENREIFLTAEVAVEFEEDGKDPAPGEGKRSREKRSRR